MKFPKRFWTVLTVLLLFAICVAPIQAAAPGIDGPTGAPREDDRMDPLTLQQRQLKQVALQAKLAGKVSGPVAEVSQGRFVELEREGEGALWTVLGEFQDLRHNTIPQPDRSVDNTTIWVPDFSRSYFMDLLFNADPRANSMRNFYIEQSSNRYTVHGDVTDWVLVPNNAVYYDDNPDANVWLFLNDTVDGWYASQVAAGKSAAEIDAYLAQFDIWDRYDYNGNGNFDEPDGYIDTFQSVHAGEGEEAGAPAWTIWSHSWYAYQSLQGTVGPDFNKLGGLQIGDSKYWVGKYTIQPENGGVGVFAHEYGHDIGLPDLYDTGGGENGTAFWTLMSSGSWLNDGTVDIGSKPDHMGAWEKFQMGWLNYDVAFAGETSTHVLGPFEFNNKHAQALFVVLPQKEVVSNIGAPFAGSYYYYSGSGDDLDNLMYKSFDLPAGATLTAKVRYNIEANWDYAYLVYSTDGGATWMSIETNRSTSTDPNGQNKGFGITGVANSWVDLTANLPAGNVLLGFRYWTDGNTGGFGFMADEIAITGQAVDGAETDTGWTYMPATGFRRTTGSESQWYNHYYIAENRTYIGYDTTLKTGPYYFGYGNNPALGNWVDHFPYQDGMLINYWDTSQRNNNVSQHPGRGLVLPIDAHFKALKRVDGANWRNRVQSYDATFGLQKTDALALHHNSVLSPIPSLPAVSVFDDRTTYYDPANPQGSVINPNTGTQVRVLKATQLGAYLYVEVRPAP